MSIRDESSSGTDAVRQRGVTTIAQYDPLAYSVASAARAVDVSETTVKQEIAAGRLPIRKLGRRTVIRRDDLLRWLDGLPERV